jgi:uncharacterized protein
MNKHELIFNYIKEQLKNVDNKATKIKKFPFRIRSEHLWRVYTWAKRLTDDEIYKNINKEAVLIAALFHDSGYSLVLDGNEHAKNSAILFREYANKNNFDTKEIDYIAFLIENHSNKNLMKDKNTPIELIVLMEADILDETGAMSIVWDCMSEGSQEEQNYKKTYDHIFEKSYKMTTINPMITKKAKIYWEEKQKLMKDFITQYHYDLGME